MLGPAAAEQGTHAWPCRKAPEVPEGVVRDEDAGAEADAGVEVFTLPPLLRGTAWAMRQVMQTRTLVHSMSQVLRRHLMVALVPVLSTPDIEMRLVLGPTLKALLALPPLLAEDSEPGSAERAGAGLLAAAAAAANGHHAPEQGGGGDSS